nr:reverse transcriptase domain-containing protein [Tanacetum cinerariifolium]
PPESIDGYMDLKAAFLTYFMQQKKHIKDPVEIQNIKQRDGETIEDFMERLKAIEEKVHSNEFVIHILQARLSPGQTRNTLKIIHTLEAVLTNETLLLAEIVLEAEAAPMASKNRMTIPTPLTEQETNIEGPLVIEVKIGGHMIHRMCVDEGSSTEALSNNRRRRSFYKSMDEFHDYMTGVLLSVGEHQLNIREGYSLIRHKKKGQAPERAKAIQAEDCYPLPEIDWKVESLCGYPFKCFLDAYKGYHQIQLAKSDEEKTAFHTGQRVYYYTKMPFGLKNADATYQRLVDKAFDNQIGQNIEVYVDDLVIKSRTEAEMLRDISEMFSEKSLPLFKTLRKCIKKSDFHWTSEAEQAFKHLMQHLPELPLLVAPKPKEELIVYMFVSHEAISMSVMLGEHNITYRPRTSVKGQILADFLAEMPDESPPDALVVETPQEPWTLFTDGSSCVGGFGVGLILTSPKGMEFTYARRFQFTASNNEAEYEALIASLRIAVHMGVCNVYVSVDSKLVACQVLGAYVTKEENMIKYLEKVKSLAVIPYAVAKMCRTTPSGQRDLGNS